MQRPLALLSVTDKIEIVPFARGLLDLGFELLSTGGTAMALKQAGLTVTDVAVYTGNPEIMDGRVKTLHPKIHGGLLYDRDNQTHCLEAEAQGIRPIQVLAVNLYRFTERAVAQKLALTEAIHHIDVGGPTMLRAAAKNWRHVLAVIDPTDYQAVLAVLKAEQSSASPIERLALAQTLATKVFTSTAAYDQAIAAYFAEAATTVAKPTPTASFPARLDLQLKLVQPLRYGENPQQMAALYAPVAGATGFAAMRLLQGKELSYNNLLDLDAACALTAEFSTPAVAIIKHTNPCGAAIAPIGQPEHALDQEVANLFRRALAADPKSAFGGIVAANAAIGAATATVITELFAECVAAPDFTPEALAIFALKKNLRVLRASFARCKERAAALDLTRRLQPRAIFGGLLMQAEDLQREEPLAWNLVSGTALDSRLKADLLFAMLVAKHVKSNAIVFVNEQATIGIGAGQMSRIDAAIFAAKKATDLGHSLRGSVMASDAFFPFRDTVDFAATYGVKAIIQPGGSLRDGESIAAAKEHGITMVLSGVRHFRH